MTIIASVAILLAIAMLILAPIASALAGQDAAQFCWALAIILFVIGSAVAIIGGWR